MPHRPPPFWWNALIAHHDVRDEAEARHCLWIGPRGRARPVCGRCAAMLPALLVTALGLLAVPLTALSSLGPLFALPAVAGVAAWGLERTGAWSPSAAPRALAGALLGAGLGLFVTVHMRAPYAAVLAGPAAATLLAALFFEALGRLRWPEPHPSQADPPASSNVESAQRATKKS